MLNATTYFRWRYYAFEVRHGEVFFFLGGEASFLDGGCLEKLHFFMTAAFPQRRHDTLGGRIIRSEGGRILSVGGVTH